MFAHEDAEFAALLRIVAQQRALDVALVEKDYWVTHVLWALEHLGFEFWFKGGTSLSKGFGLIQRFSEDLDLKIEPGRVAAVPVVANWKGVGKAARDARERYFSALAEALVVPGGRVRLVLDDATARNGTLQLHYPGLHLRDMAPWIRPFVLLEVGDARVVPFVEVAMSSFVHDHLVAGGQIGEFACNRPQRVRCVHPLVTLLEKLDAVSRRFARAADPATFVRHFEDAAWIVASEHRLPALTGWADAHGLAEAMVAARQLAGWPSSGDAAYCPDGGLRWEGLRAAHAAIGPMFFGPRWTLEEACVRIRKWLAERLSR